MVFVKLNSLKSDIFFNPIFISGFSGSRFFRAKVFQGPGPGSRSWVQGPGPGFRVRVQGPGSGSRFQKQPNFRLTGVYVLSSISKALHNFSTGFFPMYRGILELKKVISILRKNDSFSSKTCCGLTALFLKTKICFRRCNFVNKQINKNFQYHISSILLTVVHLHSLKCLRECLQFWKWNSGSKKYICTVWEIDKLLLKTEYIVNYRIL